jgi:alkylated DNA repair dioxygenase AlkB
MEAATPTPNKHNPKTNILRRQCAYALASSRIVSYEFGQLQDFHAVEQVEALPTLVQRALNAVQSLIPDTTFELFQTNYYANGSVGITAHADDEAIISQTQPIVSVTFFAKQEESRTFSIYNKADGGKLLDLVLGHGDVLVMHGGTQAVVLHGIEKMRADRVGARINITVRAVCRES